MTVLHDVLLSLALTLGVAVGALLAALSWRRGKSHRRHDSARRK